MEKQRRLLPPQSKALHARAEGDLLLSEMVLRLGYFFVPCIAQSVNHGSRTALVGQKVHALGLLPNRRVRQQDYFLVGHARRAIGDRRPDVLGRQMRIIFE